jgi:NAD(P)H-dependent FMN reductase
MLNIGVIVGSTRPGRRALEVADWVLDVAGMRGDAVFELVDIAGFGLPLLDEPAPPMLGQYTQPHARAWSARIARFDGYVFVTPEYNHGIPGALKNAIDFLYREWNDKAAGFVGYGSAGGVRAVEQLRLVAAELRMATVRDAVALSLHTDFADFTTFNPAERHEQTLDTMLDQLVQWSSALKPLRAGAPLPVDGDEIDAGGPPPGRRVGSL